MKKAAGGAGYVDDAVLYRPSFFFSLRLNDRRNESFRFEKQTNKKTRRLKRLSMCLVVALVYIRTGTNT